MKISFSEGCCESMFILKCLILRLLFFAVKGLQPYYTKNWFCARHLYFVTSNIKKVGHCLILPPTCIKVVTLLHEALVMANGATLLFQHLLLVLSFFPQHGAHCLAQSFLFVLALL